MVRGLGAATYGGKGFQERARVSGERPIGAASCRQEHNPFSFFPFFFEVQPGLNWRIGIHSCQTVELLLLHSITARVCGMVVCV